jgi:hypothetical protein
LSRNLLPHMGKRCAISIDFDRNASDYPDDAPAFAAMRRPG